MGFPDSQDGIPSSYTENLMTLTRSQYMDPLNTHTPSMLLDAQKGLPIEVEVIFGEVVRIARGLGIPVPVSLEPISLFGWIQPFLFSESKRCMVCCWLCRTRFCGEWSMDRR